MRLGQKIHFWSTDFFGKFTATRFIKKVTTQLYMDVYTFYNDTCTRLYSTLMCIHMYVYMHMLPVGQVTGGQCLLDMTTDDSVREDACVNMLPKYIHVHVWVCIDIHTYMYMYIHQFTIILI